VIDDGYLVMAGDTVLGFSLIPFVDYAKKSGTSCLMCNEENSKEPKGTMAVPPFYYYRAEDIVRIPQAIDDDWQQGLWSPMRY